MSHWILNGIPLAHVNVTDVKEATPSKITNTPIHNNYAVMHSEKQDDKTIALSLTLWGSSRFDLETSIRAELEASPVILLQAGTNEYIYSTKKECWLIPTGFSVSDEGQSIKCTLNGIIDEQTIHSCDTTIHWTGGEIALSADTRFGAASIGSRQFDDTLTCDLSDAPVDISHRLYLGLWHNIEPGSFSALSVEVHSAGGYYTWNLPPPTEGGWLYTQCALASPDSSSGTPVLTAVTTIKFVYAFSA